MDFDDLPVNKIKQLVKLASQCKHTLICFISVSGCGIKIVVHVNTSAEHHKEAYQQVMEYYENLLGVKADKSTNDIARLCFFAHDKNLFYNETAEVLAINLSTSDTNIESRQDISETELLFNKVVEFTNRKCTLVRGQRNKYIPCLLVIARDTDLQRRKLLNISNLK